MYNVEKYIYRSLNSCINQTLSNIEILIIDDCGSDNSLNIAKSFAKKDKRIKIINNKQNLGTFNARMQGIKEASGYYILFLDADDYLTTNACEVAINAVNNANKTQIAESIDNNFNVDSAPDIVFFGMDFHPRTFRRISPPIITKTLHNEEILKAVFAHCATPPWHICAKLYKASRIKCVGKMLVAHMGEDKRLTMAEDALKSFWICALARKSIGIKEKLYFYCDNDASITRKIDKATRDRRIFDISRVIDELEDLKNVPALTQNPSFAIAQRRTINILKSVVALEYRYDGVFANEGGGKCDFGLFESLYKIAQISSQVADLCEDGICNLYIWKSETLNLSCSNFIRSVCFFNIFPILFSQKFNAHSRFAESSTAKRVA